MNYDKVQRLIVRAEKYASNNRDQFYQHQIVAIAVKNGKPIEFGINKRRYMKRLSTFKCFCHAEMDLLNKMKDRIRGSKIWVFRFNNSKNPNARQVKNAKPCEFCQHHLKQNGVTKVYYFDQGMIYSLKNIEMVHIIAEPFNITYFCAERNINLHLKKSSYVKI